MISKVGILRVRLKDGEQDHEIPLTANRGVTEELQKRLDAGSSITLEFTGTEIIETNPDRVRRALSSVRQIALALEQIDSYEELAELGSPNRQVRVQVERFKALPAPDTPTDLAELAQIAIDIREVVQRQVYLVANQAFSDGLSQIPDQPHRTAIL